MSRPRADSEVGSRVHARVFVYGTLMPGQPRWPVLAHCATSWATATAPGRLWDTGRGYPAALFGVPGAVVPGVLVELALAQATEAIIRLDRIEGVGVLYRRVVLVTSAGPATSYEWLGPTDGLIPLPEGWPPP